ncbi:MAG: hypothetical protein FJW30_05825 [Acidobacteria bacterium]|nr:hypothetical protein [Acidobacteriota bacterium]
MNEQELDQILDQIKQDEIPAAGVAEARDRVWQRLTVSETCVHFREQFPAYREGTLDESKRMLLDDHLARCPGCRKAFQGVEQPAANVVAMPARRRFPVPKWAIAAGVAAAALYLGRDRLDTLAAPAGPRATVKQVAGALYAADGSPVREGMALQDAEIVRTGGGSRAVLELADGSLMEVNERTELAVFAKWSGQSVRLDRGDVIVRAAKQRRGTLQVVTRDSVAAVKGTVFTVSAGTAGSLVGVVEGAVAVQQRGAEKLLKPGEQSASDASLERVSVREAVSWSQEKERHFALLQEIAAIEQQLQPSAPRSQAKLLPLLPDDTQFYAAIPNLGPSMQQAIGLIEERSRQVEVLREWWTSTKSAEMRELMFHLRNVSGMLGDEIVFLFAKPGIPAVIAEVQAGQQDALRAKIDELLPAEVRSEIVYKFVNHTIVLSNSEAKLNQIVARLGRGANSPFAGEIARRYARGVAWIFGVDVAAIPGPSIDVERKRFFGGDNARFLFMEQRSVNGVEENEATLTFGGERKGAASWLAAPGSSGSAEYITSDAVLVLSAATRNPKQISDEIAAFFPQFNMNEWEKRLGVNLTADLAGALGNDFTFAIETPSIPIPGGIAVLEVYRPEQVTATLRKTAEAYNAAHPDGNTVTYKTETESGRVWHSLTLSGSGIGAHWTFDRGYWILSVDRATAARAIQTRSGGFQLIRSETFRSQIPVLAGPHFSGFLWMNAGDAGQIPGLEDFIRPGASLFTFTGESERIQAASRTRIGGSLLEVLMNAGPGPRAARKPSKKV